MDEFANVYSPATRYSFSCHRDLRGANTFDSDEDDENEIIVISSSEEEEEEEVVYIKTFKLQKKKDVFNFPHINMNILKELHEQIKNCPNEENAAKNPEGLNIELKIHQKRALAWLVWREGQKPSGGILADDMGLGKTITILGLILETKKPNDTHTSPCRIKKNVKHYYNGGTLIVCPVSIIQQWDNEIKNRTKKNLLAVKLYHGRKHLIHTSLLAQYDVVITSYHLVQREFETDHPLFGIKWKRIILDEAHIIRNHKSKISIAACNLLGRSRWALTGTPIHNKEMDLYALLNFLKCSPFDDLRIWKQWIANRDQDRLNTIVTSILLRRTKEQLQNLGSLEELPAKNFELIEVQLNKPEQDIYQKILMYSRKMFIEFLRQRNMKNPEFTNIMGGDLTQTNDIEYNRMHRKFLQMHGYTIIKSHEIFVLLLRLRQACCHLSLIVTVLDNDNCEEEGIEEEGITLIETLNNLNLNEEDANNTIFNKNNPLFALERSNEKLRVIQKIIEEKVIPSGDKIIVVSQWTSMLNIILYHLKRVNIKCDLLDGKIPVHKRNDIVVDFNNPAHKVKVLLLSLTAGGVGLNLVAANHLLLVDLHWNPQLESQAQDRIYRIGQKKPVHIYKIVTTDTIEERIKSLQEIKISMANDILGGPRSKLTLDDLKLLFNV